MKSRLESAKSLVWKHIIKSIGILDLLRLVLESCRKVLEVGTWKMFSCIVNIIMVLTLLDR